MEHPQQNRRRWQHWGLVLFGGANLGYGVLAVAPENRHWWAMLVYGGALLLGAVPLVRSLRLRTDHAPADEGL